MRPELRRRVKTKVAEGAHELSRRRAVAGIQGMWIWGGGVLMALAALVLLVGCAPTPASRGAAGTPTAAVPTATPTTQQRITALARQAIGGSAQSVEVTFGAGDRAVTVAATVGGTVPGTQEEINASQERVKALCFRVEQALWTSGMPLNEVVVTVVGPIYDDYADLTTGAYGAVDLKAATAAKLTWASLSPDAAWDVYQVWLRPAYRSKVLGQ